MPTTHFTNDDLVELDERESKEIDDSLFGIGRRVRFLCSSQTNTQRKRSLPRSSAMRMRSSSFITPSDMPRAGAGHDS